MISSSHMQKLFINAFPSNECEHTLDRERTSIYKITIEKIFIFVSRITIDFENIHQIVILAMDISAYCYFLLILDFVVNQGVIGKKNVLTFLYQL